MAPAKKEVVKPKAKKTTPTQTGNKVWFIILFAFTFIIYGNTLQNEYALDDGIVITNNDFVQSGFAGIKDILTYDSVTVRRFLYMKI